MEKQTLNVPPCVKITVSGRVQGVGYRYFTLHQAKRLGITGTVTNLSNGSVKIIAVGNNIAEFINSLRTGPAFAWVENMDIQDIDYDQKYSSFKII